MTPDDNSARIEPISPPGTMWIVGDTETLSGYHRGDVCDMEVGYSDDVMPHRRKVRVISRYRLRSGDTRLKLEEIK